MELSDTVMVALITGAAAALLPSILALAGLIVALRNGRKLTHQAGKIEEVRIATNGMRDELVEVNRAEALAIGERAGRVTGRMQGRTQGLQEGIAAGRADERERLTATGGLGPPEDPER